MGLSSRVSLPLLLSLLSASPGSPVGQIGPYDLELKKLSWCGDYDIKLFDSTKLTKLDKTTYSYSGNIYVPYAFNDNTELDVEIAVLSDGNWKKLFEKTVDKVCSMGKKYAPVRMANALKALGQTDCPVPAGNYTLRDYKIDIALKIPSLPYNKYRLDTHFKRKGKRYACLRVYVDVNPKKDK